MKSCKKVNLYINPILYSLFLTSLFMVEKGGGDWGPGKSRTVNTTNIKFCSEIDQINIKHLANKIIISLLLFAKVGILDYYDVILLGH